MLSFFFIFFESKRPILVPRTRLGTRGQGGRQSWVLSILLPQAGQKMSCASMTAPHPP